MKPFLKWVGGKRNVIPQLTQYLPHTIQDYVEPFLGGGAMFGFLKGNKRIEGRSMLFDVNSDLIFTYEQVRDNLDCLIDELKKHKRNHCEKYYYAIRQTDRDGSFLRLSEAKKAARFIYLNKTCYNGLYRVNKSGQFNVPMGRYKNPSIFDTGVFRSWRVALLDCQLFSFPFDVSIPLVSGRNSFLYLDPPYHGTYSAYSAGGFSEDDHVKLRDMCNVSDREGAKFMLSNSDTPFIRDLYSGFDIQVIRAGRSINSDAKGRGKVGGLVIRNYK